MSNVKKLVLSILYGGLLAGGTMGAMDRYDYSLLMLASGGFGVFLYPTIKYSKVDMMIDKPHREKIDEIRRLSQENIDLLEHFINDVHEVESEIVDWLGENGENEENLIISGQAKGFKRENLQQSIDLLHGDLGRFRAAINDYERQREAALTKNFNAEMELIKEKAKKNEKRSLKKTAYWGGLVTVGSFATLFAKQFWYRRK